jgi:hypothetical protein
VAGEIRWWKKGREEECHSGMGGFSSKAKADHERGPEDWLFKNIWCGMLDVLGSRCGNVERCRCRKGGRQGDRMHDKAGLVAESRKAFIKRLRPRR